MQRMALAATLGLGLGCSPTGNSGPPSDAPVNDAPVDGDPTPDGALDGPPVGNVDVNVLITADNAYGFGYGTAAAISNYFGGIEDGAGNIFVCSTACDANTPCPDLNGEASTCDAFGTCNQDRKGPETYVVPSASATNVEYLYIITWSDEAVTQGLIAQFAAADGSNTVYTGQDPAWEVCATGLDFDPGNGGPSTDTINEYIGKCGQGSAGNTFSGGWIGTTPNANRQALVVLDPADEAQHNFEILCGRSAGEAALGDAIGSDARWIWFDDDVDAAPSAFTSNGQARGDFLIFRLPLGAVISIS